MEYKKIEKLAYKGRGRKQGEFVVLVYTEKIEDYEVLLVETYGQVKDTPIFRIAFDHDSCGIYIPCEQRWSRATLGISRYADAFGFTGLNYNKRHKLRDSVKFDREKKDVLYQFFNDNGRTQYGSFWLYIDAKMDDLKRANESKREMKKEKEKRDRISNSMGHREKFYDFCKKQIPDNFLYYMVQNEELFLTCSHCGYRTYGTVMQYGMPEENHLTVCPHCGAEVYMSAEDRNERTWVETSYVYDINTFKEKGIEVTYTKIEKTYQIGKPEEWKYTDCVKSFYMPGRKTCDRLYNDNGTWRKNEYCRWETEKKWITEMGTAPAFQIEYISGKHALKGSPLQYSAANLWDEGLCAYLDEYIRHPELEMFLKLGMKRMAKHIVRAGISPLIEGKGTIEDRLRINKGRLKLMQQLDADKEMLEILQEEKERNVRWTKEEIQYLYSVPRYRRFEMMKMFEHPGKLQRYLVKKKESIEIYQDYIRMAKERGMDITLEHIKYPKELRRRHDELVMERDRTEMEKIKETRKKEYPQVAKNYEKLLGIYGYQDETFLIRPAESAEEIVTEGWKMNHCVGRIEHYTRHHADGVNYILMMRKVENPDEPYCTIELSKEGEILQWYQKNDKQPDADVIRPWLEKYTKQLKEKMMRKAG